MSHCLLSADVRNCSSASARAVGSSCKNDLQQVSHHCQRRQEEPRLVGAAEFVGNPAELPKFIAKRHHTLL
eukprot:3434833-Amphidinium_carterae.1